MSPSVSVPARPSGLVGESGSGKTTLGRAILGLAPVTGGSIKFKGREIGSLPRRERRALSSEIQVVFQDPYSSLNPSLTIEQTLTEPLTVRKMPKNDATARVRNLLDQVKLPRDALGRLPREFSGGQRQRIAIARALALSPEFIVCDEPVLGAGPVNAGPRARPVQGDTGDHRRGVPVHIARPGRRTEYQPSGRRDVPRRDCRIRRRRPSHVAPEAIPTPSGCCWPPRFPTPSGRKSAEANGERSWPPSKARMLWPVSPHPAAGEGGGLIGIRKRSPSEGHPF